MNDVILLVVILFWFFVVIVRLKRLLGSIMLVRISVEKWFLSLEIDRREINILKVGNL